MGRIKNILRHIGILLKLVMSIDMWRTANLTCEIMDKANLSDVQLGEYVLVLPESNIMNTSISNYSYVGMTTLLNNITVGKFCSIASDVKIGLVKHPISKFVSTYPAFYSNNNGSVIRVLRDDKVFDDSTFKTIIENDV